MTKTVLPKEVDSQALSTLITNTIKAAASASVQGHTAAYHALSHICKLGADGQATGDSRPLQRLITGLSKTGFNTKGLAFAISRYTPVTFDRDFVLTVHKADSARAVRIAAANAERGFDGLWDLTGFFTDPFWDMDAVKNDQKPVNFASGQIINFLAKANDKVAKSLSDGKITPAEAEEATLLNNALLAAAKGAGFTKQIEAAVAKAAA